MTCQENKVYQIDRTLAYTVRSETNTYTCRLQRVCHGSSPPGLYPSIRVRTAPHVSVRVRVRVSASFSFSVTLLRILFCMCPKDA